MCIFITFLYAFFVLFLTVQCTQQIIFQAIASLIYIIYNILQVVGDFKEIRAAVDLQAKSWETLANIPSFYTFNHRGKALSPVYEQPDPEQYDRAYTTEPYLD